ncbi:AraC family transcriptional regulator [Pseudoalteromonas luteoviolacea]|uniref:AraC-type DNA-binding domain-containing protein n=1 Tax=Pseudoalteromonas luteoviolacea (strain 2ta16) TaxID=1353533 RepID=V4HTA6_PSEL2|nr:AraC family transcriptional regulator [Pseudoalteromonas luteoviolacea]ESP91164.1 AraC-type DNA-binding domain-containing protein [Pseudoalteromonas luteoviolacea 2ta16]KZN41303.1 hypothetical protein N483_15520 [Pseudoalteromonas luteoviolacea NCIMB 1944]
MKTDDNDIVEVSLEQFASNLDTANCGAGKWSQACDYRFALSEQLGHGESFGFSFSDGSAFQINELNFEKSTKLNAHSGVVCGAFFVLEGHITISLAGGREARVPKGHVGLFFIEKAYCTFLYKAGFNKIVNYTLSPALMSSLMAQYDCETHEAPNLLYEKLICLPMTQQIKCAVEQIYACQFPSQSLKLLIHAKMMELIALLLEHNHTYHNCLNTIKKVDLIALEHAAAYLKSHMQSPPSIGALAKIVGINDHKLKSQFKLVFGQTLYGYLAEARLFQAMELLENSDMPIVQIARQVGYKHAGHFAKNFKACFGTSPSEYRKRLKLGL